MLRRLWLARFLCVVMAIAAVAACVMGGLYLSAIVCDATPCAASAKQIMWVSFIAGTSILGIPLVIYGRCIGSPNKSAQAFLLGFSGLLVVLFPVGTLLAIICLWVNSSFLRLVHKIERDREPPRRNPAKARLAPTL